MLALLAFGLLLAGAGTSPAPAEPAPVVTVVVAGDIASCASDGDERTAALVQKIDPDAVLTLGDNAYPEGTAEDFANCYDPTWGAFRSITYPAPGNHEYLTPGGRAYYDYFGSSAPAPYYSFDLGAWHLVSLNSEVPHERGSPQERWLRRDLAQSEGRCELLYWHRPRFSVGSHGSDPGMQALWQAAYDAGVDLVLVGHDHNYQRYFRLDGRGRRDPWFGVRQLVVGTGGAELYPLGWTKTLAVADGSTDGVLKLHLRRRDYDLSFLPASEGGFRDSIRGQRCHGAPVSTRR